MKIEIDKDGYLWLERGGTMERQYCPFHGSGRLCGDWCPHFSVYHTDGSFGKMVEIVLCKDTGGISVPLSNFTDKRGQE